MFARIFVYIIAGKLAVRIRFRSTRFVSLQRRESLFSIQRGRLLLDEKERESLSFLSRGDRLLLSDEGRVSLFYIDGEADSLSMKGRERESLYSLFSIERRQDCPDCAD